MTNINLNTEELADRWRVSKACLERWRGEGTGPVYIKLRGKVIYRLTDIEAFEAAAVKASTSKSATTNSSLGELS